MKPVSKERLPETGWQNKVASVMDKETDKILCTIDPQKIRVWLKTCTDSQLDDFLLYCKDLVVREDALQERQRRHAQNLHHKTQRVAWYAVWLALGSLIVGGFSFSHDLYPNLFHATAPFLQPSTTNSMLLMPSTPTSPAVPLVITISNTSPTSALKSETNNGK